MFRRQFLQMLATIPFFAGKITTKENKEYNVKDRMSREICNNSITKTHVTKTGIIIRKQVQEDLITETGKIKTEVHYIMKFDTKMTVMGYTGKPYVKLAQWFSVERKHNA